MSRGGFAYSNDTGRFLACEPLAAGHRFAVVGVPFDGAGTHRPGARFGPQAIRHASLMLCDGVHPLFDVTPLARGPQSPCLLGDALDLRLPNASGVAAAQAAIAAQAAPLAAAHHCVFLGGDHAVTLPLLRAVHARHGRLALVHFDAHCDTWSDHFGEPAGHGTWVREAIEAGLVDPARTVQIGIRSPGERAAREYVPGRGGLVLSGRELRGRDGVALQPLIDAVLARVGDAPAYLTFDIDALDPAFAPGTGTPEAGGLTTAQALTLLEGLAALRFVGMDCCEVAPAYDHAQVTSLAAATLVWTYLCGRIARAPSGREAAPVTRL
jgi:agmatinase